MTGIQKRIAVWAAAVALAFGCLCAMPAFAHAQAQVTGVDYLTAQDSAAGPGYIDVLSVQGHEGDSIYVNVDHNGETIASHLLYTLTADSATAASDGSMAGIMSLQIPAFQATDAYSITVYADYDETQQLYAGTTTGVFAQLGDNGATTPIGVRTIGGEQRTFNAPDYVSRGGIEYQLNSDVLLSQSPLTFSYSEETDTPDVVDGTINFVDDQGSIIAAKAIKGLQKNAGAEQVNVPYSVQAEDGSYWMPVNFSHTVTASYPGTRDFTVVCKKLSGLSPSTGGSSFVAKIVYQDESGTQLFEDTVPVTKLYYYAPPQSLSLGQNSPATGSYAKTYSLASKQDAPFDSSKMYLILDPASNNQPGAEKTYVVTYYSNEPNTHVYYVNLWLCPTSSDQALPTKPFATATYTMRDGDAPQSFDPANNAYVDSTQLDLAPGMQTTPYEFSYGSNASTVTNVYYVPKGEKPAANPYQITIQYRNAADRSLIESHTYTVSPNDLKDTVYTSPERFTSGQTTYVRLKGQEAGIQHGYYTMFRTYTVWYRDINNSLLENVVVNPLTYAIVDNGTTTRTGANGAAGAGATTGAAGANAAGDGTAIGLGAGTGQNVLTGADGQGDAALNGDGQDANSERIGDNETPLAADAGADAAASDEAASPWWTNPAAIVGIVGACLAAALLLFLLMRRRKQHKEE